MLAQELAQEQATVSGTTTDHIPLYQKVGFLHSDAYWRWSCR
jgi:hypothetical protein